MKKIQVPQQKKTNVVLHISLICLYSLLNEIHISSYMVKMHKIRIYLKKLLIKIRKTNVRIVYSCLVFCEIYDCFYFLCKFYLCLLFLSTLFQIAVAFLTISLSRDVSHVTDHTNKSIIIGP